jgi:peptidoglycan/xylan/chitin deacetylase (PgdA/CDA1 family)
VYPLLKHYEIPATFFLATGYIGTGEIKWEDRLSSIIYQSPDLDTMLKLANLPGDAVSLRLTSSLERARTFRRLAYYLSNMPSDDRLETLDQISEHLGMAVNRFFPDIMLTWDEVRQMARTPGISFGCHTVSHNKLSALPDEALTREILESKTTVERELGTATRFFAYPYGTLADFDDRAKRILHEVGFDCAVSTLYFRNDSNSDLFALGRVIGANSAGARFSIGTRLRGSFAGEPIRQALNLWKKMA